MEKRYIDVLGRKVSQRGFVFFTVAVAIVVLVPMVGLAIDSAMCYVVKAKLSSACDAASLAAARNLNVGLTVAQQQAAAVSRGTSFYYANYPANFMWSTLNAPTVNVPINQAGNTITVTTTGSASVRPIFMQWFGNYNVTVNASGTATRRDVNVVMVLDRSNSMQTTTHVLAGGGSETSCQTMVKAATAFLDKFVDGRDNVSVVTFGSSAYTAFPIARNFKSGSPSAYTAVSSIQCGANTSTALGYWTGYQQLQTVNAPGAFNVILLFTDGVPNGVSGQFTMRQSDPSYNAIAQRYGYNGGSSPCNANNTLCSMPVETTCTTGGVRGSIAQLSGSAGITSNTGYTTGPYVLYNTTTPTSTDDPMLPLQSGCNFLGSVSVRKDVAYLPDVDAVGNATLNYTNQYIDHHHPSNVADPSHTLLTTLDAYLQPKNVGGVSKSTGLDHWRVDSPRALVFASSNALDNAAMRTRADTFLHPVTYVIGLGEPADPNPPDDVLMERVANDPRSPIFVHDTVRDDGMYIAADPDSLADAFLKIASEVLRISK